MTFDSSFYDFLRKNFFNNTKSQDIHLSEVENTLKKVEKTSERNPSSVLDNLYALLATLAVRSAHDVGLVRLHLADKVALVVFPILAYYTGKYHLNDTMLFLWLMAAMPILGISVIWGINELSAWLERRKKKQKLH